jgi:hypothetical protein
MTTGGGGRGGLLDGIKGKDSFELSMPIYKRVAPSLTRLNFFFGKQVVEEEDCLVPSKVRTQRKAHGTFKAFLIVMLTFALF